MDNEDMLLQLVYDALDFVYDNDSYLIDNHSRTPKKDGKHYVGERAIVFRFAYYLQTLLNSKKLYTDYNLDCEYNRNGTETKSLPSFPNGTYPDVIIHKRGRNDGNILVMEFKTYWNSDQRNDDEKIRQFTDMHGKYKFVIGMTVLIEKNREEVEVKIYKNGELEHENGKNKI